MIDRYQKDFVAKYGNRPQDIVYSIAYEDGRKAGIKEVGEWLKGRCTKTHCSGDIPTGYLFYIDVLSMNSILQGKMQEEGK